MFDKGSFIEVMGEWAQTVICGRARLVYNDVFLVFVFHSNCNVRWILTSSNLVDRSYENIANGLPFKRFWFFSVKFCCILYLIFVVVVCIQFLLLYFVSNFCCCSLYLIFVVVVCIQLRSLHKLKFPSSFPMEIFFVILLILCVVILCVLLFSGLWYELGDPRKISSMSYFIASL